jgi:hypothetical protein
VKKFSPLAEIPGHAMPPGAILVTADSRRRLLIPRWIGGYAMCKERFKSGVPTLPRREWLHEFQRWTLAFYFCEFLNFFGERAEANSRQATCNLHQNPVLKWVFSGMARC